MRARIGDRHCPLGIENFKQPKSSLMLLEWRTRNDLTMDRGALVVER